MSDVNAPHPGAGSENGAPPPAQPDASEVSAEAAAQPAAPVPATSEAHAATDETSAGRPSREPPDDPARRRDKAVGTVIVVVAFILSLAISLWAKHSSRPEVSEPPRPPTTEGVVGFPAAVDPVATLPAARKLTKRPMLRGIVIDGVAPNGTIDVEKGGSSRARYTFQSPPGHGPQPPREPGTLSRQHYCGKQSVQVKKSGVVAEPDRPEAVCPGKHGEPLPDPQCSLKDLWEAAIKRGAPSDRTAKIEYYRAQAGPAWRFEIPGSKLKFSLYGDCRRELTGAEAQNL
jgi:hypothetical protein